MATSLPGTSRRRYLVGVSGGRDSMVLLHALHAAGFGRLVVCHLNHGLRGQEATRDANLVRRTARRLGLPCEVARVNTAKMAKEKSQSIELAARELRLAFFSTCASKFRCSRLILAHHADDQIETILFQFLRGSGAAGLSGMPPVSSHGCLTIYRPLLTVPGEDIAQYASAENLAYAEDSTNQSPLHTRNRIRHQLLPLIEDVLGTPFRPAILRAAEILREENAWIDAQVPPCGPQLDNQQVRSLPLTLQRRLILLWLRNYGPNECGFAEVERVRSLLDPVAGPAKVNLPRGRFARRRQGKIFLQ